MCLGVKHTLTSGGRMQEIEPNDSQVHSHFESYIHAKIMNI
jgi:hypothetical protein